MTRITGLLLLALSMVVTATGQTQKVFTNPLYQGEDPWVIFNEGQYYVCTSGPLNPTAVYVSKSPTLIERGEKVKVWEDADNYGRVFAPELHFIQGKWYIYFCADAKSEGGKHMAVVLQSKTDDPLDGFTSQGVLFTGDEHGNAQANDFTVVTFNDQLYAFWGSLADQYVDGVLVAPMDNPTTITAHRKEMGLHAEGPRVIVRDDKLILTGATGGFASKNYALVALLYSADAGPIDEPASWKDLGTLMKTTENVWGPSRASFTISADGSEDWMMYHSKIFPADDNGIRAVNIKEFSFSDGDIPDFGIPLGPDVTQPNPAGDPGLGEVFEAEDWNLNGGAAQSSANKHFSGTGYLNGFTAEGSRASFDIQIAEPGNYRVVVRYSNGIPIPAEQKSFPTIYPPGSGTLTLYVNGQKYKRSYFHRTTDWDTWMLHGETLRLHAGKNEITYQMDDGDTGLVALDYAAVSKASTPPHGLLGSYYDNADLTGLKFSRIDPDLNFDWGTGSPDASIGNDSFSARWLGFIEARFSGIYEFYSKSDNGRRLKIDGKLVIDKWLDDHDQTYTGTIDLQAGKKYPIVYEYFDADGGANTRLEWSSEHQAREVVPSASLSPPAPK